MTIVMMTELPGADASMVEAMKQAGVLKAMAGFRGFGGHWSGATGSSYRVIEVWDSREDWPAWYDSHIQPNVPPGAEPNPPELFELNHQIKPAD